MGVIIEPIVDQVHFVFEPGAAPLVRPDRWYELALSKLGILEDTSVSHLNFEMALDCS